MIGFETTASRRCPMSRQDQINLLKRLLHYVETRTTTMADSPWRNEVSAYTDTERLAEEQRILFRKHPIVMGFASEWSAPGAFRTEDYAGLPIRVVRGRDEKLRAFLNVCRPALTAHQQDHDQDRRPGYQPPE